MSPRATIDAATEAFLARAAADLRSQLGVSAVLDSLRLARVGAGVELVATLTVAGERLDVSGRGATLVEAYARLRRSTSLPVLESAYRQVLEL